jgi:sulfite exporter TauE/SafE
MGPLFTTILKQPGAWNTLMAGVVTGILPCGLVYAFVSLAGSSADLLEGAAIMFVFGLGTIPMMVLAGCGSSLLNWSARQWLWKLAAWSVMATGLMTVGRGVAFLQAPSESRAQACPYCSRGAAHQTTQTTPEITTAR